ncbi:hypothetical protein HYV88_00445 [Candidatus Woesearchaeota archaeon]|nr:hypothetical protein [Candidatus Woesearchaeota archaeon]
MENKALIMLLVNEFTHNMERKIQILSHGIKGKDDISVRKVETRIFDDKKLAEEFREFAKRNNELNFHWYSSSIPTLHSLNIVDGKVVYEVGDSNSIEALAFLSLVRNRANSLKILNDGKFTGLRKVIEQNRTLYLANFYFGLTQNILGVTKDDEIVLLRRSRQLSEGPGRYNVFSGFISSVNEIDGRKVEITDFTKQAIAELSEESGLNPSEIDVKRLQLTGLVRGLYNSYLPSLTWVYRFGDLTRDELLATMKRAKKYDRVHLEHDSVFFLPLDRIHLLFDGKPLVDKRGVKFAPLISEDDYSKTGLVDDTIGGILSYLRNNNHGIFEEAKTALEKRGLVVEMVDITEGSEKFTFRQ